MGQYKVPQDVESEDQIIAGLTIKQFIYAVIGIMWGFVAYAVFIRVMNLPVFFVAFGVPPAVLFLLLGLYRPEGQPFEARFLALVSYFTKPRKRLWEKEPIWEVFKIEAPKITVELTQRDPQAVRSQLENLSRIVDTRGYGTKQASIQEPVNAQFLTDDRLAEPEFVLPSTNDATDVELADDMFDLANNPQAAELDNLINDTITNYRQDLMTRFQEQVASEPAPVVPAPGTVASPSTSGMTTEPPTAILKVAQELEDLPISQLAAQVGRMMPVAEGQEISLTNATTSQPISTTGADRPYDASAYQAG